MPRRVHLIARVVALCAMAGSLSPQAFAQTPDTAEAVGEARFDDESFKATFDKTELEKQKTELQAALRQKPDPDKTKRLAAVLNDVDKLEALLS